MVYFWLYFFKLNVKGGVKYFDISKKNLNIFVCNKYEK